MLGPAKLPPPCIIRYSISVALSAALYKEDGHLASCCHLVVERMNYYLLLLALYLPEIQTSSPDLQPPATKDNAFKQKNPQHARYMLSAYFRTSTDHVSQGNMWRQGRLSH
jgi:hypothetical protein